MNPAQPRQMLAVRQSMLHDAVDANLIALLDAHRALARLPAGLLAQAGTTLPPSLAALGHWHDAMLRSGYFSLIAMNRLAGGLTARWLADGAGAKAARR